MPWAVFLIFLTITVIILRYIEKSLVKKYHIPKTKGFFYNYVNTQHKVIEISLLLVYIFGTMFLYFPEESRIPSATLAYSPLVFLIVLHLIRAFTEWKYERETNRYRLSLLFLAFCTFLLLPAAFILEKV
ncbi:DUF4181 domain-containing protein [Bacillus sp. Hm123]|uniref:DUF4181 domain-containing protein n=1 Tax=Bacillus sp. Hm123 TaxID=3450745 RepID=UPI003F4317A7